MLAFLYFVQMLINFPKMMVISWNNMISFQKSPSSAPLNFRVTTVTQQIPEIWLTPDDVIRSTVAVNVSVCHVAMPKSTWLTWKVEDRVVETRDCSQVMRIRNETFISVTLSTPFEPQKFISELISPPAKPYWVAAIGDSYSSGQGNPEIPMTHGSPAKWLDDSCYRSSKAFPYRVSQKINISTSLSFLSCSGSTVDHGILSKNGQMERLEKMILARGAPPDVLFLTVGGNDIGFTDVISMIQRDKLNEQFFDMRFFFVSHQIDRVARRLEELNITRVVILDYYDVTRNEKGVVDGSCGAFRQVSLPNLQLAERKIFQKLNSLLRRKAKQHGWVTVDTTEIFRTRGICSKDSLIRSRNESMRLQGNEYGSFHPNEDAHEIIAEKILKFNNLGF